MSYTSNIFAQKKSGGGGIPQDNLTAEWKCEETAGKTIYDSKGNFNLTFPEDISTSAKISSVEGQVGNGLYLNSGFDTCSHPHSDTLNLTDGLINLPMTFTLWTKLSNTTMFSRKGTMWNFRYFGNLLDMRMRMHDGTNVIGISSTSPPRDSWIHIAVVFDPYDADYIRFYLDSTKLNTNYSGSNPTSGLVALNTSPLNLFGGTFGATTSYDEAKLYMNKALSQEEITAIYNIEK